MDKKEFYKKFGMYEQKNRAINFDSWFELSEKDQNKVRRWVRGLKQHQIKTYPDNMSLWNIRVAYENATNDEWRIYGYFGKGAMLAAFLLEDWLPNRNYRWNISNRTGKKYINETLKPDIFELK